MTYERTIAAATAETASKFRLAEALALDIPPRVEGQAATAAGDKPVEYYLEEARQAIIDSGGEPRHVVTLRDYRATALWVKDSEVATFRWVPGSSFSAHKEARARGVSYADFAARPRTVDVIRREAGRPGTDGPPEKVVQSWTPEQQAVAVREVLANPETARMVFDDPASKTHAIQAIHHHNVNPPETRPEPERSPAPAPAPPGFTKLDVLVLLGQAKDALRRAFKLDVSLDLAGDEEILSDLADVETEAELFRRYHVGMGLDEAIERIMEGN